MTKCTKRKIALFKMMGVNLLRLFTVRFLIDTFKSGFINGIKMWFATLVAFVAVAVVDTYHIFFEKEFPHCTRMTITDKGTTYYPEDE